MKTLFFDFPDDEESSNIGDQFMFGDKIPFFYRDEENMGLLVH